MKRKRKKKVETDGKRLIRSNGEKLNRASLSGLNVKDETRGMLKEGNVKRKSLSKRRSESCDVVDEMSTKRDKRFSKNENRVEAVVFGDENEDEVALSNGAERRIRGEVDGECSLYSAMCNIGGENAVSSISSKVRGECVLCSAEVGKVKVLGGESKVAESDVSGAKVDQEALCYASESGEMHKFASIRGLLGIASGSCPKVGVDVHKFGHIEVVGSTKSAGHVSKLFDDAGGVSEYFVSESESGAKVGKSKEAVWMGSKSKVGVDVTGVACKSCSKMGVGVQKSENGRVDGSIESADWVSEDITSKNDQWVGDNGATEHWCVGSANSERGRVLEVAQNVATLDGFVSLGKSSVTKKEF